MTQRDALDYIRGAGFYNANRYLWAKPIIDAVISNTFGDPFVYDLVDSLYKGLTTQLARKIEAVPSSETLPLTILDSFISVKRISSIDNIKNIGLVDLTDKIQMNESLNIIYGKNASGKSSLYVALCNLLGFWKPAFPNLNKDNQRMYAKITVLDQSNKEIPLEWTGKPLGNVQGVRIFDIDICSTVVESDQVNQFELAYLKSEYFPLLINAFSTVGTSLSTCIVQLQKLQCSQRYIDKDNSAVSGI